MHCNECNLNLNLNNSVMKLCVSGCEDRYVGGLCIIRKKSIVMHIHQYPIDAKNVGNALY